MTYNDSPLPSIVKDSDIVSILNLRYLNLRYLNLRYFNSVFVILSISLGIIIFYFITIQSYLFATNTYQNQKKRERQLTFAPISNHFGCYIPLLGLIQASSLALFYIFLISILLFLYFFRKCVVSCVSSSAHLTA